MHNEGPVVTTIFQVQAASNEGTRTLRGFCGPIQRTDSHPTHRVLSRPPVPRVGGEGGGDPLGGPDRGQLRVLQQGEEGRQVPPHQEGHHRALS